MATASSNTLGAVSPARSLSRWSGRSDEWCAPGRRDEGVARRTDLNPEATPSPAKKGVEMGLRVVHERCAGIDVHKRQVVVCGLVPGHSEVRTFGTMTGDLLGMVEWLSSLGIVDVAMESTGVYWKPVYNVLEVHGLRPVLGNASKMRRVPGRKTDVRDAEWIAELHHLGLVEASNVPHREQRDLRELTRYRRSLVQERTREAQRVQKVLEGANIKLSSVASDVLGKSGREMLRALIAGDQSVEAIADLAQGRLRDKREELMRALEGVVGAHQRFLLEQQLSHIEDLERRIEALDQEVAQRLRPFDELIGRLDEVPGFARRSIEDVLAEIGTDMSHYPSESHLASWAKICPGSHETGGHQLGGPTGKGNPWLKNSLIEASKAASRTRKSFFHAKYHRLVRRMGANQATVAIAHSLLRLLYRMIQTGARYQDLGADYYDERGREAIKRNLLKRLEKLDYHVEISDRRQAG